MLLQQKTNMFNLSPVKGKHNRNESKDKKILYEDDNSISKTISFKKSVSLSKKNLTNVNKNKSINQSSNNINKSGNFSINIGNSLMLEGDSEENEVKSKLQYNKNLKEKLVSYSLGIFSKKNKFRLFMIKLCLNKWFLNIILLMIMINSLILIFETDPNLYYISRTSNYFFTAIFILECVIKIIAFGFYEGNYTYLHSNSNKIDFLIVLTSIIDLMPFVTVSIIYFRLLRIIRPLKSIAVLPSLKRFVRTLISSFYELIFVLLLFFFFFCLFTVIALILWNQSFNYRCRVHPYPINGEFTLDTNFPSICGGKNNCGNKSNLCLSQREYYNSGYYFFNPISSGKIDRFQLDYFNESLNWGLTKYDNVFTTFWVVFQSFTLEAWSPLMFTLQDGNTYWIPLVYYIFLVMILGVFILNLTVAVLLYNFQKFSQDLLAKSENKSDNDFRDIHLNEKIVNEPENPNLINESNKNPKNFIIELKPILQVDSFSNKEMNKNTNLDVASASFNDKSKKNINKNVTADKKSIINEEDIKDRLEMQRNYGQISKITNKSSNAQMNDLLSQFNKIELIKNVKSINSYQKKNYFAFICYSIIAQPLFLYFLNFVVLINIILMLLNRTNISELELKIDEYINVVSVFIFIVEFILSILGLGIYHYFNDFFNINDFIITILSTVDISIGFFNNLGNENDLNKSGNFITTILPIIKILRLLRFFKIVKGWETFTVIIISLKETLLGLIDYSIIFVIFVYIYSLIGNQLFSGALKFNFSTLYYDDNIETSIKSFFNFDTFLESTISVYSIIIGHSWSDWYYNCLRSDKTNNILAYTYFITLVFFGRIILLNIFLAYLIDNFESARKFLQKNIFVKDFLDNTYFMMSKIYYLNNNEIDNDKKDLDKFLLNMASINVLTEGRLKFYGKADVDNNKEIFINSKEKALYNKGKKEITDFDNLFYQLDKKRKAAIINLEQFYDKGVLKKANKKLDKMIELNSKNKSQSIKIISSVKGKLKVIDENKEQKKKIEKNTEEVKKEVKSKIKNQTFQNFNLEKYVKNLHDTKNLTNDISKYNSNDYVKVNDNNLNLKVQSFKKENNNPNKEIIITKEQQPKVSFLIKLKSKQLGEIIETEKYLSDNGICNNNTTKNKLKTLIKKKTSKSFDYITSSKEENINYIYEIEKKHLKKGNLVTNSSHKNDTSRSINKLDIEFFNLKTKSENSLKASLQSHEKSNKSSKISKNSKLKSSKKSDLKPNKDKYEKMSSK
jgi:hypothetical protein